MLVAIFSLVIQIFNIIVMINALVTGYYYTSIKNRKHKRFKLNIYERHIIRQLNFRRMVSESDLVCIENIRMDRSTFYKLCNMLQTIGRLAPTKNMNVEEMVAIFLYIISHHAKNRIIKREFVRSGETVSRQFGLVLNSILRLQAVLLKKPKHVLENSTDFKWKWFKVN